MMKQKIGNICKLSGIYAGLYLIATAFFIGLFHTPLLKSLDVLMYRGTVFIVLSGIFAVLLMAVCRHVLPAGWITIKDMLLLFCGCCCINMVLFTLIPVTVERSISVFMLSYMDENADLDFTEQDMEKIFVDQYVDGYGAFEKRFHEQIVTGSICSNGDGSYRITERGKWIVKMFRMVAACFGTDRRLVYPDEYQSGQEYIYGVYGFCGNIKPGNQEKQA